MPLAYLRSDSPEALGFFHFSIVVIVAGYDSLQFMLIDDACISFRGPLSRGIFTSGFETYIRHLEGLLLQPRGA